jgi:hypothetical protein
LHTFSQKANFPAQQIVGIVLNQDNAQKVAALACRQNFYIKSKFSGHLDPKIFTHRQIHRQLQISHDS